MRMNDAWIRDACKQYLPLVQPFIDSQVNPASYDLRIGRSFYDLLKQEYFFADSFILEPGMAILATTIEFVMIPDNIAATLYLKSSAARAGLDHALAGYVDPGFSGELTFELHAHRPYEIVAGKRIAQLAFDLMNEPAKKPYQGRYVGQTGPTIARPEKP
jgi:dCTP deaminase